MQDVGFPSHAKNESFKLNLKPTQALNSTKGSKNLWSCIWILLTKETFTRGMAWSILWDTHKLAESFYYVNYGLSIIISKVRQIISVVKT